MKKIQDTKNNNFNNSQDKNDKMSQIEQQKFMLRAMLFYRSDGGGIGICSISMVMVVENTYDFLIYFCTNCWKRKLETLT